MKIKTVFFATLWCMLIPIAFYGATFVTLWLDNVVDEPLCSLSSVIAITVTLAPVIMGFLADAQKTREKNFKLAFTMLAMIVLVFNIGGLLFLELTTLPKPFFTGMYAFLTLLNISLFVVSGAFMHEL
ncbi:MAG: hypothetical protein J6T72_04715 [Alphaproteobacteria bacterium]|nr:hypothetical protein [Alphaproteobacteria bacterium]